MTSSISNLPIIMCSIDYCENKLDRLTVLDRPTVLVRQSDIMQVQDAWMTALLSVYPMMPLSWNLHNPSDECSCVCGKRHKGREWRSYEILQVDLAVCVWQRCPNQIESQDAQSMWTGQTTDASGVAVHVDDPSCRNQNLMLL